MQMIYKHAELVNVAELREIPGRSGELLQRVPQYVNDQLREHTKRQFRRAACTEIRFVSNWSAVDVTLGCYGGVGTVLVYLGNFQVQRFTVTEEICTKRLELGLPCFLENIDFHDIHDNIRPYVWRLVLHGAEFHLIDIEGPIRPPLPDEVPKRKYLAYGTSITYGEAAISPELSYVMQTGWHLETDVINLGAAGSAFCEKALADYIADRNDWDIASISASVNMYNQGVPVDEFYEHAKYMVHTIAKRQPEKPVICIGLFTFFGDYGKVWPGRSPAATPEQYRAALKRIVDEAHVQNLHYIDGRQLLPARGLSHDLLHPGNDGMREIGIGLSAFFRSLCPQDFFS